MKMIDESARIYADIDEVMANRSGLVAMVHTLNQRVCIKGRRHCGFARAYPRGTRDNAVGTGWKSI
jgi:hypothetical protein